MGCDVQWAYELVNQVLAKLPNELFVKCSMYPKDY